MLPESRTKNPNLCRSILGRIGKSLHILWSLGILDGNLAYFMVIWLSLWSFGKIFPILVCFYPEKIWQPCSVGANRGP
jgi:hypothetical protein